jgi:hypothetical protein
MVIDDYSPDRASTTLILDALWKELFPAEGKRPAPWQPSRVQVKQLRDVPGISIEGAAIIKRWLQAGSGDGTRVRSNCWYRALPK